MECRLVNMLSGVGESYPLHSGFTSIGRDSDNDIQIMSEGVSRHHARVNNMQLVCELEDLESTNGTFVNSDKIARVQLRDKDEIRIGDYIMRFEEMGSGGFTSDTSTSHDYSDRSQHDTIRLRKIDSSDDATDKTKTTPMRPVSPLRPKSE